MFWAWYGMSSGLYHQDKTEGVLSTPFLVERTPLFPSVYSKRLRALGSSPSQTQQVLDAVPARAGPVWFALFFPPELKAMHTILFGDFFFSAEKRTDKMNDCPGPQLRSSREPSSRPSECHVGHVCDIQRKRFEDRSLGTLHMDIHTHPDARLSAACLPQYWRWDSPPTPPREQYQVAEHTAAAAHTAEEATATPWGKAMHARIMQVP